VAERQGCQAALTAWSRLLGGEASAKPLAGGSEAFPLRVDAPGGRFVLRRYAGPQAAERAAAALAAAGCAWRAGLGPRPVPTDAGAAWHAEEGQGCVWTLSRYLAGRPRRRWSGLLPEEALALGEALARLHAALRELPPDLAGPAVGGGGEVRRRGRSDDQVLHGDPSPGNVLWRAVRQGPAPVAGFVDFDRVDRGPVERDLARALVGLPPWAGSGGPALAAALLAGYRAGGGRVGARRLREGLAVALAEGEAWLGAARLTPAARRKAERWLARARAVRMAELPL
jgi:Ser/Thr protein kinase RdoA (MazF antagonist)